MIIYWFDDYINVRPPQGESVKDQRKEEIKELNEESIIGVFTHGGILINALVVYGNKTYDEVYNDIPPYGSIIVIEV